MAETIISFILQIIIATTIGFMFGRVPIKPKQITRDWYKLPNGKWVHIVWDGCGKCGKLYVNGKAVKP